MINHLVHLGMIMVDICALLNVVLIVDVLFGAKLVYSNRKLVISCAGFFVMEIFLEFIWGLDDSLMLVGLEYLFMFLTVFFFAETRRLRTAILTLSAVIVYMQWGNIGYLVEMLLGLDKYKMMVGVSKFTPMMLITDLSLVVLLFMLKRSQKSIMKIKMTLGELIFVTIFCFFSPVLVEILASLEAIFNNKVYDLTWVVLVLLMNGAVIYGIFNRKKARYYKNLSETYRQQFGEEYTYFKEYKDNNRDMMKFRHDWNNHMIVMQDLLEQGKYEEAKKYFDTFPVAGKGRSKRLITGSETVDTIFAAKVDLFERFNIDVKMEGELTRLVKMEPVDICILFSNLIDNAIEACSKFQGNRYLRISVTESPNVLMISLMNPMAGELIKDGAGIRTTKEEKNSHGIGLQNVEEIVTKYNGEYYIEAQDGEFRIMLVLGM